MKITGWKAIEAKESNPAIVLRKYNDPIEPERVVTLDEAREIAKEDPSLIYTEETKSDRTERLSNVIRGLKLRVKPAPAYKFNPHI